MPLCSLAERRQRGRTVLSRLPSATHKLILIIMGVKLDYLIAVPMGFGILVLMMLLLDYPDVDTSWVILVIPPFVFFFLYDRIKKKALKILSRRFPESSD